MKSILLLIISISVCQIGWTCESFEDCLWKTNIGSRYSRTIAGGICVSEGSNKPLSKEQAQLNVSKAIAYQLKEIGDKLDKLIDKKRGGINNETMQTL